MAEIWRVPGSSLHEQCRCQSLPLGQIADKVSRHPDETPSASFAALTAMTGHSACLTATASDARQPDPVPCSECIRLNGAETAPGLLPSATVMGAQKRLYQHQQRGSICRPIGAGLPDGPHAGTTALLQGFDLSRSCPWPLGTDPYRDSTPQPPFRSATALKKNSSVADSAH